MTTSDSESACLPPAPVAEVGANHLHLHLTADHVVVRRNGLEFLSTRPLAMWAEVTVDVRSPASPTPLTGTGVVVDCSGSPEAGYAISLLFTQLSAEGQEHLEHLARSLTA